MSVYVFSRTLKQQDHPGVTIVADGIPETIAALRARPARTSGCSAAASCRTLLDLGCVDSVEPAVVPVLLGGGIPFLPAPALQTKLSLTPHRVYPTCIVLLEYAVQPHAAPGKRRRKKSARPA
ncbi:MAG: dihydrofolate reductase family protein [Longimicrobiales bacterium]